MKRFRNASQTQQTKLLNIASEAVQKYVYSKGVQHESKHDTYCCPICGFKFPDNEEERKTFNYCKVCGQKLDWEQLEEVEASPEDTSGECK